MDLSLLLIHEGRWEEAIRLLSPTNAVLSRVSDTFNLAIAHWGQSGRPSLEHMTRAYEAISDEHGGVDANFHQCASIAAWAVGERDQASRYLDTAVHLARTRAGLNFSCWRYAYPTANEFLDDCQSIRSMIQGEEVTPLFITRHSVSRTRLQNDEP